MPTLQVCQQVRDLNLKRRMNQIRRDLLERATRSSKDFRRTVAVDQANSFIGGVHEGAWMTVGFLTEHPPVK